MAPAWATNGGSGSPELYMLLGVLGTVVVLALAYIWMLHRRHGIDMSLEKEELGIEDREDEYRIDRMGLSKKAEDVLSQVIEVPMLQNELPGELGVSKATVSNAVGELFDRGLIRKKKKANTYLIEPDLEEIEAQER